MPPTIRTMPAPRSPQAPLSVCLLDAARAVAAVLSGRSLTDALIEIDTTRRPAAQAVAFHVMRTLGRAQVVRNQLVARQPPNGQINALLLVALSLLDAAMTMAGRSREESRGVPVYAPYTVVDQAVRACASHKKLQAFKSLVNGVLRRYLRERDTLSAGLDDVPLARWNHPGWWGERLCRDYPDSWQRLLAVANQHAPLALRVNHRRASRKQVLDAFAQAGIAACPVLDAGLVLDAPHPVQSLPGYTQGWWSVQDPGAQRAASLLPLRDGMRVLDACAAPGGKTAHILERADVEMLALDADAQRLARVKQNLARLGLLSDRVRIQAGDAADPASWWDGRPFDAVLADVPCTASGIVRRHPDIRWLRQPGDVARTAALQARIADALWSCVASGGHLLYATCSIFPEEGEIQAQHFAARHLDAKRLDAPGQLLPVGGEAPLAAQRDGFYYALFAKCSKQG